MSVSRRRFLQHGTFAAAACVASPLFGLGGRKLPPESEVQQSHVAISLYGLSRESFTGLIGSSFKVSPSAGSAPVWLRLLAVHDLPGLVPTNAGSMAVPPPRASSSVASSTGFMLEFSGPGTRLAQETYAFEHERLGKFAMFIVPAAPGQDSYMAVFNLLNATNHSNPPAKGGGPVVKDGGPVLKSGGPSTNGVAGSSVTPSGSGNAGGSGARRPAQEHMEPLLRNRQKLELPE